MQVWSHSWYSLCGCWKGHRQKSGKKGKLAPTRGNLSRAGKWRKSTRKKSRRRIFSTRHSSVARFCRSFPWMRASLWLCIGSYCGGWNEWQIIIAFHPKNYVVMDNEKGRKVSVNWLFIFTSILTKKKVTK